jgi:hypothetical protein
VASSGTITFELVPLNSYALPVPPNPGLDRLMSVVRPSFPLPEESVIVESSSMCHSASGLAARAGSAAQPTSRASRAETTAARGRRWEARRGRGMLITSWRGYAVVKPFVEGCGPWSTSGTVGSNMGDALRCLAAVAVAVAPIVASMPPAEAATTATVVRITETSDWAAPSPDPSGIGYLADRGRLVVVDGEVEETRHWAGKNVWFVTLAGEAKRSWSTTDRSEEPVAVSPTGPSTMWFSDDDLGRLLRWRAGADGRWSTQDDRVKALDTTAFGNADPEGVAVVAGAIFVTDGADADVDRVDAGENGVFDGVAPNGDDEVSSFDTASLGIRDPEGIAYDAASETLLLVSRKDLVLVRVTLDGTLVESIDLSTSGILRPSDVTLAPGSDDAAETHAYITDRGVDNGNDPDENDGRIFEFELVQAPD